MNGAARKSVWESLQSALEARGVGVETTRGLPPVVMVEAIGDKEVTIGWNTPLPLPGVKRIAPYYVLYLYLLIPIYYGKY